MALVIELALVVGENRLLPFDILEDVDRRADACAGESLEVLLPSQKFQMFPGRAAAAVTPPERQASLPVFVELPVAVGTEQDVLWFRLGTV